MENMNTIKQTNSDSTDMIFYKFNMQKYFHTNNNTKKILNLKISHRMQLSEHTNHINIGCHSIKYTTNET